jgi:alkylation response protein AidB-like acyl-CoA dehydrogenase
MHFGLSSEQQQLADAVSRLVARRAVDLRAGAGYDRALWETLCSQIGAAALAIPEEYGGAGATLVETHVVLEQLGTALTPSPLLGSAVLAAQALLAAASPDDCQRLLPGIASGATIAALAWSDATFDGSLTGAADLALDGYDADVLLVAAGAGLYEVTGSFAAELTPALDPTLRFARLEFDHTPARLLNADAGAALARVRDLAAVAVTALQVGGAQACLDRTVEHLKRRVQFDRPLGSFQALKHRVADLLVLVESARSMSWAAAWAAAHDPADLPLRAALAKAWCSEAFSQVAAEAVQLHGGIAITWEHDVQLYFKRAHATAQLFGAPHVQRRRLLEHL